MDSNTYSNQPLGPLGPPEPPVPSVPPEQREALDLSELPEWLAPSEPLTDVAGLAGVMGELAAADLDQLSDAALTRDTLALQRWMGRLEGQWLRRVAAVDARGAAGADQGQQALSTAGWLRNRLRMGAGAAREAVRTARALFRGPLVETADALMGGAISPAHARVLAQGTRALPDQVTADAEPVLVEAASRLDPPLLRQAVGYLLQVADPDGADAARQRRPPAAGAVAGANLGRHGRGGWAAGGRGWPHRARGPGTPGPPGRC
jgi:hypothetical protein